MSYVLQTSNLTRYFGRKAAVNEVSLNVKKGDIYGLIGRNGAGKTTFIRLVAGLAKKNRGEIRLFESGDLNKQRRKIGTMIETPAIYPNLTAKQNLHYYCLLLGIDPVTAIEPMLSLVGLSEAGKKKAKHFSLGMKQRLAIAIALLGDPEFLMLDEPMNGLDPTGVREMRELILKLNKEKKITILISSHILGELSKIATYYGVINNGKLIDEFTLQELKEKCAKSLEISVDDAERAVEILRTNLGIFGDELIVLDSNTIRITKNLHRAALVNTELARNGVSILSSQMINHDMEDFFLKLIMKS
ncbi:ATP-binding cassette domain-containing protein [Herbinix luporum]|uniref:Bacitracin transport ATP-binding protein BcrA n=1 Tax=Herbinix luporum TaxID=1679721 RepID=A0A0K8J2E3_9FIRM|nr:ATP-binding cassette domain-containing protein [Herbinix luporum]MDI9489375.1 ATP-binding cassette domain-containing protein [Bacillota bacterium]CUH91821.1 Bacitracin transport ATP-binding protein BcrA [Herbinix luporum]HHT57234.1 ATP-binding cassette domain-containing protein [Herbinix luporum]